MFIVNDLLFIFICVMNIYKCSGFTFGPTRLLICSGHGMKTSMLTMLRVSGSLGPADGGPGSSVALTSAQITAGQI